MAFPVVESLTATALDGDATAHLIAMPATVNDGDLLITILSNDGPATVTTPANWNLLGSTVHSSNTNRLSNYYKIAVGTEGGTTVDFVTSVAEEAVGHVYRISNWHGTTPPEIGTAADAASTLPNPPTLTPSWGAADTLWLAGYGADATETTSVYPTNYTNGQTDSTPAGGSCTLGSARRELNATSDDPGTFTISASEQWIAQTFAIRPSSAIALTGTLFTKTPTFNTGTVAFAGALTGTLFAKAATFPTGVLTAIVPPLTEFPIRQQISTFLTGTSISGVLRVAPLEDNIVFAVVSAATTLANMTGPSGYTKAAEEQGDGVSIQLWYKRAGAAESATVTATSSVSVALKIHVFESPAELFPAGDPLDVVDTNDSSTSAVTTLSAGTTATVGQPNTFAIAAVTALGGNTDFLLVDWSDGFTALSDHETRGLMVAFKAMSVAEAATATATWNQATSPTSHKAAGLVATFEMAVELTLPTPAPKRVSFGTRRAPLNPTGTVDTISTFPIVADHLYLAFVGTSKTGDNNGDAVIANSHGGAVTWTLEESYFIGAARRIHMFRAMSGSDLSEASISITTPAIECLLWWEVIDVTGVDLSGTNGSGAIRQTATADEPLGDTFVEATFALEPLMTGAVVGLCLHGQPERQLVDNNPIHLLFAEGDVGGDGGQRATVDWYQGSDQTFRWEWASSIHALAIIAELVVFVTGVSQTPNATTSNVGWDTAPLAGQSIHTYIATDDSDYITVTVP